jgi:DNA-binding transcriptional MocR family regulator
MPRPLAAFDDRVITLGSASKTFWGGLRVGWVRAPLPDVPRLQQARLSLDLGVPVLEQLVLATLLDRQGAVLEHRRAQLRRSRDALVGALHDRLPDWRFSVPPGGLSLWCELPAPRSTALCDAALPLGIRLAPGSAFGVGGGLESCVRIPFALEAEVLVGAVDGLARAWRTAVEGPVRPAARASLVA